MQIRRRRWREEKTYVQGLEPKCVSLVQTDEKGE